MWTTESRKVTSAGKHGTRWGDSSELGGLNHGDCDGSLESNGATGSGQELCAAKCAINPTGGDMHTKGL
eukprot:3593577-Alexandrium_andersonii.AAC.1